MERVLFVVKNGGIFFWVYEIYFGDDVDCLFVFWVDFMVGL